MKFLLAMTLCAGLLLMGARDPYDADADPGANGEPGTALKQVYSKEFRVSRDEYFAALDEFYSFARIQVFERIDFGDCFSAILDFAPNRTQGVPCLGVFAVKGAPTKAHMTFTVVAKSYNTRRRQDFLTCRVGIYINDSYKPARTIAPDFQTRVDGRLEEFDRKVGESIGSTP